MFAETELDLLQKIIRQGLAGALGETLLMTFVPTVLAFVIGLPLGVLLVTGEEGGIRPLPRWLMKALNTLINILRSVPFLILLIVVLPLSRVLVGTTVGTKAILAPLVMYFAVILLVILVQLFQSVGNRLVKKADKRIR